MIFDDHDVHDDWNISWSWVEEMRAKPWWDARITGAFMAYWIYQHLGNLSPPELAEETTARARQARRRRRAAPPRGRPQVGPRVGREPLGLLPRLRRLAAPRHRLARRARARRRPSRDGRRGGVGLDRRPLARRLRPSRDREHAARLHACRDPPPRGVERGRLRRALGQGRRAARRAAPARRRPRALGGVRRVVRPAVRLVAQSRHRRGRHDASRVHRPPRRRRAQQLPRRGRSRRGLLEAASSRSSARRSGTRSCRESGASSASPDRARPR